MTNKTTKHKGIRGLTIDGKNLNDAAVMANEFNSYFVQSVEDLCKDFSTTENLNCSAPSASADCFYIQTVDETKVTSIIAKLSNSKSNDIFNIDCCFLKKYSSVLRRPLTHLVNLSIRTCKFPSDWKKAVIIPIFKAGSLDSMCNYRPISILPILSKVLEKVVAAQLIDHLESNQLLHPQQFSLDRVIQPKLQTAV